MRELVCESAKIVVAEAAESSERNLRGRYEIRGGSAMELENYFDFVQEDVIRIKGNRIDIEIVLERLSGGARVPEENSATLSDLKP